MAEKSVVEKLLIKPGQRVRFINPPADLSTLVGSLPENVTTVDETVQVGQLLQADVIVLFANHRAEMETLLPGLRAALAPNGSIWVAYHKGTSRTKTDINRDKIYAYALTLGLQGVAMISINDDWSALRLKLAA